MGGLNIKTEVIGIDLDAKLLGDLYQAVFEMNYIECQTLQQSYKAQINNVKLDRERKFEKAGLKKSIASEDELTFSQRVTGGEKIENWMVV